MRFKGAAMFFNRYMLRIFDYSDNIRSSRRVLCVASQMINSRNGLSCKLHNVIFGIFHNQYFMCYNIYVVWFVHDLVTITQGAKPGFWVKTGTACCKRFDAKKTYLYISRNKLYLDYPHRFLLEICRNHLNNMTLYVNTAISQFGVSNGMGQY